MQHLPPPNQAKVVAEYRMAIDELRVPGADLEYAPPADRMRRDYDAELSRCLERAEAQLAERSRITGTSSKELSSELHSELKEALARSRGLAENGVAETRAGMSVLEQRVQGILAQLEAEEHARKSAVITGIAMAYGVPAPAAQAMGEQAATASDSSVVGLTGTVNTGNGGGKAGRSDGLSFSPVPALDSFPSSGGVSLDQVASLIPALGEAQFSDPGPSVKNVAPTTKTPSESKGFMSTGPLSWADMKRTDELRLQVGELKDGAVGPQIGTEFADPGAPPIYMMLGIDTDPTQTFQSALLLAERSRRPVIPIINETARSDRNRALDEYGKHWESLPIQQQVLLEPMHLSGRATANAEGLLTDIGRAVHDRFSDPAGAYEPSIQSMRKELLPRLLRGERIDVDAHSQGTVNAKAGAQLIERDLSELARSGQITNDQKRDALSNLRIFATGAFADPNDWPTGVNVIPINDERDIVSMLGGWVPPSIRGGTKQHSHDRRYMPDVAEQSKQEPGESSSNQAPKRKSHGASGRW